MQAGWKLRTLSGLLSPEAVLSGWPHLWFSCCLVFENLLSSFLQSCPVLKLLLQAALETSRNQKKVSKIKKNIENSKETIQNQKKHREIERFCPKPKETSRNRKKTKKPIWPTECLHDTSTLSQNLWFFWFFRFLEVFFGFGQNLSVSRCFFFGFGQEPDICKGGVRWRTVCMIPAHCPRILFFPRFWPECSKIRCVQKPNAHRVPF